MSDITFTTIRSGIRYCHLLSEDTYTHPQEGISLEFRYGIHGKEHPDHTEIKLADLLVIPVPSQVCYSRLKDLAQAVHLDPQKMVGDDSLDSLYWGEAIREYSIPIDQVTLGPEEYNQVDIELDIYTFLDDIDTELAEIYRDRDPEHFDLDKPTQNGHLGYQMLLFYGTAFRGAPTQVASEDELDRLEYTDPIPSKVVARDPDRTFKDVDDLQAHAHELDYPLYVGPVTFGHGSYGGVRYKKYGIWYQ
jgi:hypothetical protein